MAVGEALDVLHQVMCTALHCRIHMNIKMASNCGIFFMLSISSVHTTIVKEDILVLIN